MEHDRTGRPSAKERAATTPVPPAEAVRLGDERAEAGDWLGAVRRWRAAAVVGGGEQEAAAEQRLRAFVRHVGATDPAADRVPRRAIGSLAICLQAALFGVLTMILGNRVEGGQDAVLLWVGWASFAVAAVAAVVFAARSGRLDGTGSSLAATADPAEVAAHAEAIATRLATAPVVPTANAGSPRGAGA